MNEGYIKLYRKILDNPTINKDNDYFKLWIYLLLSATHKERKIIFGTSTKILQPGELVTGREKISNETGIQSSKVERILKTFENEQQIEQQKNTKGRIITVLNWEQYQISEQQNEQQVNNKRTTNEQQMNTNKNDKNVKNDKNERNIYSRVEEDLGIVISPSKYEKINYLINKYGETKFIEAVSIASNGNKNSLNYVEGILKNNKVETKPNWLNENITKEEISEEELEEINNLFE